MANVEEANGNLGLPSTNALEQAAPTGRLFHPNPYTYQGDPEAYALKEFSREAFAKRMESALSHIIDRTR